MKINTFIAIAATAIVGASVVLLTTANADASERYKHHCSSNINKPTIVENAGLPLTKAIVAVQTRRYFPGVTPKIEKETKAGGKTFYRSKFVVKQGTLKQCFFRTKNWTTK